MLAGFEDHVLRHAEPIGIGCVRPDERPRTRRERLEAGGECLRRATSVLNVELVQVVFAQPLLGNVNQRERYPGGIGRFDPVLVLPRSGT